MTEDESVTDTGAPLNGDATMAYGHEISADGRVVAFLTTATNLRTACRSRGGPCRTAPPSAQGGFSNAQVAVRDRFARTTELVSTAADGTPGAGQAFPPAVSLDGSAVAFASNADNLVPGDTNGMVDTFVWTRATGELERVSVSSSGQQQVENEPVFQGPSFLVSTNQRSSLSADGRYVVFNSLATNLVPDNSNGAIQEYLHDRLTGATIVVSVSSSGETADSHCLDGVIAGDAPVVAFASYGDNLAGDNSQKRPEVFVHVLT
jgi:hypothetical protein